MILIDTFLKISTQHLKMEPVSSTTNLRPKAHNKAALQCPFQKQNQLFVSNNILQHFQAISKLKANVFQCIR
jgi:hypothetical protein